MCVCVCMCMCESSLKHTLISDRFQGKHGELSQISLVSFSMGRAAIMESVSSLFILPLFKTFAKYRWFVCFWPHMTSHSMK